MEEVTATQSNINIKMKHLKRLLLFQIKKISLLYRERITALELNWISEDASSQHKGKPPVMKHTLKYLQSAEINTLISQMFNGKSYQLLAKLHVY